MVNGVLSSLPTFYMGKLKLPPIVVRQIYKYRKHCMWRGADLNARKPPLAAWNLATKPKKMGGLGIINLHTQNDALLLKNLHKFYNRVDCPWVNLSWDNLYKNGKVLDHRPKGSLWWRAVLKHMNKFKGIAMVQLQEGSIVLLWHDMWNSSIKSLYSTELFSDTTQINITVQQAKEMENLHDMFQLPMSNEAFQQYLNLMEELANLPKTQDKDVWTYIWGNSSFTVNKAYQALTGHTPTHPVFNWLWKSK
jgi:hypothetical protein